MVSVIIPVYNGEKYLQETIESVLNQTYQDFELIIVDDGSTDKSAEIIKAYFKKNPKKIKFIQHSKNSGCPAATKNTGLRFAKGEYVAFLDQDDIWLPRKLEKQIKIMEAFAKTGLVITNAYVFDQKSGKIIGRVWKDIQKIEEQNLTERLLLGNFVLTSSCALIKREIVKKVGIFDENFSIADDYDFWFRVSKYYEIKLLKEPQVIWRKTDASTSSNEEKKLEDLIYFWKKRKKEGYNSDKPGLFCFRLANFYLSKGEFKKAKEFYQRAKENNFVNFKICLIEKVFDLSPTIAKTLMRLKRKFSQYLISPKSYLEIEK